MGLKHYESSALIVGSIGIIKVDYVCQGKIQYIVYFFKSSLNIVDIWVDKLCIKGGQREGNGHPVGYLPRRESWILLHLTGAEADELSPPPLEG
jgi:hypothetical protein